MKRGVGQLESDRCLRGIKSVLAGRVNRAGGKVEVELFLDMSKKPANLHAAERERALRGDGLQRNSSLPIQNFIFPKLGSECIGVVTTRLCMEIVQDEIDGDNVDGHRFLLF